MANRTTPLRWRWPPHVLESQGRRNDPLLTLTLDSGLHQNATKYLLNHSVEGGGSRLGAEAHPSWR
jgi:hypothetical protein